MKQKKNIILTNNTNEGVTITVKLNNDTKGLFSISKDYLNVQTFNQKLNGRKSFIFNVILRNEMMQKYIIRS